VLNVFAYTGAFGVYAAAAGAARVTQVDSSAAALELAERNMALNGFARPDDELIAGDAFEVLRYYRDEERQFDAVVLDPPKFATSQGQVDRACRGYKDLNWLALRLLRAGRAAGHILLLRAGVGPTCSRRSSSARPSMPGATYKFSSTSASRPTTPCCSPSPSQPT
jgi:23S rRNA G2069 N7-methylase RlmK/C1962 C5-methylase RlmI